MSLEVSRFQKCTISINEMLFDWKTNFSIWFSPFVILTRLWDDFQMWWSSQLDFFEKWVSPPGNATMHGNIELLMIALICAGVKPKECFNTDLLQLGWRLRVILSTYTMRVTEWVLFGDRRWQIQDVEWWYLFHSSIMMRFKLFKPMRKQKYETQVLTAVI